MQRPGNPIKCHFEEVWNRVSLALGMLSPGTDLHVSQRHSYQTVSCVGDDTWPQGPVRCVSMDQGAGTLWRESAKTDWPSHPVFLPTLAPSVGKGSSKAGSKKKGGIGERCI